MRWLTSMSAFTRVILGLLLGVFTGLFFGELAGSLDIFGEAYIRLLQMTVLPYILVSLIGGLGRLNANIAQRIGITGGILILFYMGYHRGVQSVPDANLSGLDHGLTVQYQPA